MLRRRNKRKAQDSSKTKVFPWLFPGVVAIALFLICAGLRGLFHAADPKTVMGVLSDCFTVPGALLGGVAAISWVGTFGQFDILSYGAKKFLGRFFHPLSADMPDRFYDYREEKNKKGRTWLKRTFFVGLACLGMGCVMLIVYHVL